MKRIYLAALALPLLGLLAGCDLDTTTVSAQQNATAAETSLIAQHNANFNAKCSASTLVSQERTNLCDRAKRINVQNMQSCVSLFTQSGALVAFYPVKGKVSSLNSYLLAGDQVWSDWNSDGYAAVAVEAPDIDGAYGKNADGIFFFTSDTNSYVEWQGDYLWSDQCLTPSVSPLLVRPVADAKPAAK